jgi:hypothetical protein
MVLREEDALMGAVSPRCEQLAIIHDVTGISKVDYWGVDNGGRSILP